MSERGIRFAVFFAALFVCALVTKSHADSWNDRSRFATIESLTVRHTFAIDGSPFTANMKDEYRYGGRTYSDKPPLPAIVGAGVASVLAPLGVTFARTPAAAVYLVTLVVIGGSFAAGVSYAFAMQRDLGVARPAAILVAALTGIGTLALPYATVFANHVPAGAAALAALVHARRRRRDLVNAGLAGLFAALAVACDAGALPFMLGVAVLLARARPVAVGLAVAAALPVLLVQAAFNHSVSGGYVPPAINPGSWVDPTSPFHNDFTSLGRFPSVLDYGKYGLYLLVGDKGLFSYSPVFLVSVAGLVLWARRGTSAERLLALAIALPCAVYVALIVLYTDDYTSYTFGDRRYAEIAFVLAVPLAAALRASGRDARLRGAAVVACAASVAVAALGTFEPFAGPEGISSAGAVFVALLRRSPLLGGIELAAFVGALVAICRGSLRASGPLAEGTRSPATLRR